MVYTGCPSGSELRVVNRGLTGCAVPSVREVWFCVGLCRPSGVFTLWYLWNLEYPWKTILLCYFTLRHKRFFGFFV